MDYKINILAKPIGNNFVQVDSELFSGLFEDKELAAKVLASMHLMSLEVGESENFKDSDNSCKRIILKEFLEYVELFKLIEQPLKFDRRVILGIDGRCGAGKTTLAKIITRVYGGDFISTDDFYLPFEFRTPERMAIPGGHINYERFIRQVLDPIKSGRTRLEYENFNCFTKVATPIVANLDSKIIVIEGSYSLHPWVRDLYSHSAFLDIPDSIQKERILKRNGEEKYEMFKNIWIPFEDNYRKAYKIDKYCSIMIDNT